MSKYAQLPSLVIIFHTCIWLMEDTEHKKQELTDYTVWILEDELDPTVLVDEIVSYSSLSCRFVCHSLKIGLLVNKTTAR